MIAYFFHARARTRARTPRCRPRAIRPTAAGGRMLRHAPARWTAWLVMAALFPLAWPGGLAAHPGALDEYGGHFDERTGIYHYHRPQSDLVERKRDYLTWIGQGESGELRGDVAKIDRPDALWVLVPYRPAYQDLVPLVAGPDRDDHKQLVRVWLRFISPEASVTGSAEYTAWFHKKVMYELDSKLTGKPITVQFRIFNPGKRMKGMLLQGDENINLWLVLNGWSYVTLTDGENPHTELFRKAEETARTNKVGLWERAK